jgi:uncharacterized membrane protein
VHTRSAKLSVVPAEQDTDEEIPGIDRLLALTDGVVAIALTLLVLQLQVPVSRTLDSHPSSPSALWKALDIDFDELTSYLVSFVVIAQFWLVHHRVLRRTRGHSEGLAWRNFGFLLALTLTPFTSDLLGRYSDNPVAVMFFGLNIVAISLSTQWIFYYAAGHGLLRDTVRSAHAELVARVRAALVIGVVTLSIVLAWTDTRLARFVWLLFLLVPAAGERVSGRIEGRQGQIAGRTVR